MTRPRASGQYGRFSRLTHDQVASIRRIYRDYKALLSLRTQLCNELNITSQHFCNVGRGVAGKKPKPTADY